MGTKLRDKVNYVKRLTPRRSWNAAKVLSSFYWSRWTGKPRQWGWPISMAIEPTTACNLGCPECPSGLKMFTRPTGNLKTDAFRSFLDETAKHLSYLTFYFQGEPYINPDFLKMVRMASDRNIYTATSTNAHFISKETAQQTIESGLDRMIISIDGTTQEVYEQYRKGGSLERVLEGT
ncbi:MAG: radical SAM protein, partial [Flavobacteriales bacterium]|nr:radical SAM protein [Flavobacteriales bacterium]